MPFPVSSFPSVRASTSCVGAVSRCAPRRGWASGEPSDLSGFSNAACPLSAPLRLCASIPRGTIEKPPMFSRRDAETQRSETLPIPPSRARRIDHPAACPFSAPLRLCASPPLGTYEKPPMFSRRDAETQRSETLPIPSSRARRIDRPAAASRGTAACPFSAPLRLCASPPRGTIEKPSMFSRRDAETQRSETLPIPPSRARRIDHSTG